MRARVFYIMEKNAEKIINEVLKGTTVSLEDLRKINRNAFLTNLRKQISRRLKEVGYKASVRAFLLRRTYQQIRGWDKDDEKSHS